MAGNDLFTKLYAQLGGDATGSHDITLNGGVVLSPDTPYSSNGLGSWEFDGADDYATIPNSTDFDFGSGDFTINLRANVSSWSDQDIVGKYDNSDSNVRSWLLFTQSDGDLVFGYHDGSTVNEHVVTWAETTDEWVYISVVRDGTDLMIYVNAVQAGSTYNIGTDTIKTVTTELYIGRREGASSYFGGNIADIEIIKGVAVTPSVPTTPQAPHTSAVLLACRYGEESQGSAAGHELTTVDGMILRASGPTGFDGAYEFNGSSHYVQTPSSADLNMGSGAWTIEAFVYLDTSPSSSEYPIISKWASSQRAYELAIDTDNKPELLVSSDGNWDGQFVKGSGALNLSEWTHLVGVYDESALYIYKNGVLGNTFAYSSGVYDSTAAFQIGVLTDASRYFDGKIANVRVSKGIARIFDPNDPLYITTGNYEDGFEPPTGPYIYSNLSMSGVINNFIYGIGTTSYDFLALNPSGIISYFRSRVTYEGQYESGPPNMVYGSGVYDGSNYNVYFYADSDRTYSTFKYSSPNSSGDHVPILGSGVGVGMSGHFSYDFGA